MIGCTADRLFDDVRNGAHMLFDDGRIPGLVERCEGDRLRVRMTQASGRGARFGSEKGINVPDTELKLPALTDKDRADLVFVVRHADMVALSFVNSAEDVRELRTIQRRWAAHNRRSSSKSRRVGVSSICRRCCSRP
jgi:pyruvate kinase